MFFAGLCFFHGGTLPQNNSYDPTAPNHDAQAHDTGSRGASSSRISSLCGRCSPRPRPSRQPRPHPSRQPRPHPSRQQPPHSPQQTPSLLRPQRNNRILLGCRTGRDQAADHGQDSSNGDKHQRSRKAQDCRDVIDFRDLVDDVVDREQQ